MLIIDLHRTLGNKYAQIAKHLPGRTDSAIKNFWNYNKKRKLLPHANSSGHTIVANLRNNKIQVPGSNEQDEEGHRKWWWLTCRWDQMETQNVQDPTLLTKGNHHRPPPRLQPRLHLLQQLQPCLTYLPPRPPPPPNRSFPPFLVHHCQAPPTRFTSWIYGSPNGSAPLRLTHSPPPPCRSSAITASHNHLHVPSTVIPTP
ncbi:unnamed protein product [Lactuca saligna]|uniref:HTH myb-type domain-containing protein n=1 Tax=Lactuca saligna TaxID=75948 RepID=A0AA36E8F2_LACSI|nr:unnamed protein product [Lactuca saligna]